MSGLRAAHSRGQKKLVEKWKNRSPCFERGRSADNLKPFRGTLRGGLPPREARTPWLASGAAQSNPGTARDSRDRRDSFRDSSSGVRTHFRPSTGLICGCPKSKKPRKHLVAEAPCQRVVGDIGLEHPTNTTGKTAIPETGGAESGALLDGQGPAAGPERDPMLDVLIRLWPTLTLEQRAAVVEVCMRSGPSCDMRRKSANPE